MAVTAVIITIHQWTCLSSFCRIPNSLFDECSGTAALSQAWFLAKVNENASGGFKWFQQQSNLSPGPLHIRPTAREITKRDSAVKVDLILFTISVDPEAEMFTK